MPKGTLCVYHTNVVYQFSEKKKEALDILLLKFSHKRPLWRLESEGRWDKYILSLIAYRDGAKQEQALAQVHPHGTWLHWH